jgi:4-hydroxy-tetrahydrodipicolinate reductase
VTRLAIFGQGKMGRLVSELAASAGFEVTAHRGGTTAAEPVAREALGDADVAIDFTVPSAAPGIIRACAAAAIPVVSGTTGWDVERSSVESVVKASRGALLWAPNFAIGVHHFAAVIEEAARRFLSADSGFEGKLVETHHTQKLDSPSGTAKLLASRVAAASGRAIPISSVRVGTVPGTHEFFLDSPFEQVRLVHEARDRRVFAAGALKAARWLVGKQGVYTLDDLLGDGSR